jgi:hypothetical protein
MEWNRSETLGLSTSSCSQCRGTGLVVADGKTDACKCVLRAIFRACYSRFVECAVTSIECSRCSLENASYCELPGEYSRKNEEYVADFLLVTKRTLTPDEYRMFRYRYVLGADWALCCRKLQIDKGSFHHLLYRLQHKLGRIFRELQPYALYPLDDYFSPGMRTRAIGTVVAFRPTSIPVGRMSSLPLGRAA